MVEKLFVYGTLCPNQPNDHILNDIGGTWERASVKGSLKQEGWGAKMGYPGLVLNEVEHEVNGYVFSSENLSNHWDSLDEFEGKEYQRLQSKVKLANGDLITVYMYTLSPK
ncbi:hypothetical protein PCIT_a4173 [Pseudoalteromonas citrea]|uniref:Putative gamma-glutamylcyclotransferase n=2 Tax=Pseudoalteromonas citrea TaxID=43655 RepID=A0AAD4AI80_9GAMM|nr:gamma-glutamylcyclotransferase family protein [Pseudoalteromonas citrea]KAF7771129.1 hypothetical protein PCIT_a4173 [Pseudoalteromonas citrea]